MNPESLKGFRQSLENFKNRPFDKAASNLACISAAAVLPTCLVIGTLFRTFEGVAGRRDWEQIVLSCLYTMTASVASLCIASRAYAEARQHNFIPLVGSKDENMKNNPPPQPPTGGTF